MEVYLDNAATTRPSKEALDAFNRVATECYGNASALHGLGLKTEKEIKKARQALAGALCCDASEIVFTSGGTESDNLAILGAVQSLKHQGRHIITTKMEHHAVLHTFAYLEANGWQVSYIGTKPNGEVDLEELKQAVRPDTVFISVMAVNNETGVVQPIEKLKEIAPKAVIHSDCVQALGKIPLNPSKMQVDLMSFSAHKVHALKGVGALYVKKGIKLSPQSFGGDQEGIRSGTMNAPGIVAFGLEAERIAKDGTRLMADLKEKREYLKEKLLEKIPEAEINGENAVHILNVGFDGVRGEVLLHALENVGVYVSTGSACTSKSTKISHVLESMGVRRTLAQGSVRISLGNDTTYEELDLAVEEMAKQVAFLKRFKRR